TRAGTRPPWRKSGRRELRRRPGEPGRAGPRPPAAPGGPAGRATPRILPWVREGVGRTARGRRVRGDVPSAEGAVAGPGGPRGGRRPGGRGKGQPSPDGAPRR